MIETFVSWLVKLLLDWLLRKAVVAVQTEKEKIEKQLERGRVNEENVVKYEAAQARTEKIKASLDLLNRRRS